MAGALDMTAIRIERERDAHVPRDEDGPSLMDNQLAFAKSDNGASLVNEHDLVGKKMAVGWDLG